MEIYGYSERGAMNALFYGMALDRENGENSMREFLKLAGIKEVYSDFNLYMEFSLSEFGNPDLVIIAKTPVKTVFFVEAKVSCGKIFSLGKEKTKHESTINKDFVSGESSNLFFQLRLKHYFFNNIKGIDVDCPRKIKETQTGARHIGKNVVVQKFAAEMKDCTEAKYIAVVPDNEKECFNKTFGMDISVVSWEEILKKVKLRDYMNETIKFNQNENISQILNNPLNS